MKLQLEPLESCVAQHRPSDHITSMGIKVKRKLVQSRVTRREVIGASQSNYEDAIQFKPHKMQSFQT